MRRECRPYAAWVRAVALGMRRVEIAGRATGIGDRSEFGEPFC